MLSLVYGLVRKYDVDKMYIDGANPSFIESIKLQIGEVPDYESDCQIQIRKEEW